MEASALCSINENELTLLFTLSTFACGNFKE